MVDPISLVATPTVTYIINLIANYIKEETIRHQGLWEEVQKINRSLKVIKLVVERAEERQYDDPLLRDWLEQLQNVAYDAQDILETLATEVNLSERNRQIGKFKLALKTSMEVDSEFEAMHKIKEISTRLDNICQERRNFHFDSYKVDDGASSRNKGRAIGPDVDITSTFGRESDKEQIIQLLQEDNSDVESSISVIPIVGMAGVGKTTLAQLVFNDERVESHFSLSRMWVYVTSDFNLTRILKEIIESYSKMPLEHGLTPALIESRFRDFLPGKKFLLVLDDVWCENYTDWEPLLQLLKLGKMGSKVIVTSRSENVARVVGTYPSHHLEILPEGECWSLFKKVAFKGEPEQQDLVVIGNEIVKKCQGLPLAVKVMAGLLRGRDVREWKAIANSSIWEIETKNSNKDKPQIMPALRLSYNYLPSNLKQCFCFCSIFPKAYAFKKIELVKLWMAEAFVLPEESNKLEDIGVEYFDELTMRSFFQPSSEKDTYMMHDLLHDLARSVSSTSCRQISDVAHCNSVEKFRHFSLLSQDVEHLSSKLVQSSPKLRTLLVPGDHAKNFGQALDKIFRTLEYIRVLDLSSSTLTQLPKSIEELKLLHYLDLSRTEIQKLTNSICNLYNLQTLKLVGCPWLFSLPKDFSNLVNLLYLELDDIFWFKCSKLPPRIGKLTSLHNLHAFPVGCDDGYKIEELKGLACLSGDLHISNLENAKNGKEAELNKKEGIQKLVFEWTDRDSNLQDQETPKRVLEELQPHPNVTELEICHYRGSAFPTWMEDGLLQNLITLRLIGCTNCKILKVGHLPHLQSLYLKELRELEEWSDENCNSLLRVVKISKCPKLRKLPDFLPVEVLKIKSCSSLESLPVTPKLLFLILVDNLTLADWKEMMLQTPGVDGQGQPCTLIRASMMNVIELTVRKCPKLSGLPRVFAPQKLEIEDCESLASLPSSQFARRLQHLALKSCNDGTLVNAIPTTYSMYSLVISDIKKLTSFPKLPHLPSLQVLYIHSCKELVSLCGDGEESLRNLTSLKLFSIHDCPELTTLAEDGLPLTISCLSISKCPKLQSLGSKEVLKNLTSLEDLYIEDCSRLDSLPEDGLPASVCHLYIHGCSVLLERCQKEGSEWHKIKHIPDLEVDPTKVSTSSSKPSATKRRFGVFKRLPFCGKGADKSVIKPPELQTRTPLRGETSQLEHLPEQPNSAGNSSREIGQAAHKESEESVGNAKLPIIPERNFYTEPGECSSSAEARNQHYTQNLPANGESEDGRGAGDSSEIGDTGADSLERDLPSTRASGPTSPALYESNAMLGQPVVPSQTSPTPVGGLLDDTTITDCEDEQKVNFHGFQVLSRHVPYLERIQQIEGDFWNTCIFKGKDMISNQLDAIGKALAMLDTTWDSVTPEASESAVNNIEDAMEAKFRVGCLKSLVQKAKALNSYKKQIERTKLEEEISSLESHLQKLKSELQILQQGLISGTEHLDLGSHCLAGFLD